MEADALTHKRCSDCGEHKPVTEYYKRTDYDQYVAKCKPCYQIYTKENYLSRTKNVDKANLSRYHGAKRRAKYKGIEFTIPFEEIVWPSHCPVLGVLLDYSLGDKGSGSCKVSPSLDRIIPSKGYVSGNVIVVSSFVNTVKNCATVDQLKKVAAFYEQLIPQVGGTDVQETD